MPSGLLSGIGFPTSLLSCSSSSASITNDSSVGGVARTSAVASSPQMNQRDRRVPSQRMPNSLVRPPQMISQRPPKIDGHLTSTFPDGETMVRKVLSSPNREGRGESLADERRRLFADRTGRLMRLVVSPMTPAKTDTARTRRRQLFNRRPAI